MWSLFDLITRWRQSLSLHLSNTFSSYWWRQRQTCLYVYLWLVSLSLTYLTVFSQLLGEADTLLLVSQLLQSIDKISNHNTESWTLPDHFFTCYRPSDLLRPPDAPVIQISSRPLLDLLQFLVSDGPISLVVKGTAQWGQAVRSAGLHLSTILTWAEPLRTSQQLEDLWLVRLKDSFSTLRTDWRRIGDIITELGFDFQSNYTWSWTLFLIICSSCGLIFVMNSAALNSDLF